MNHETTAPSPSFLAQPSQAERFPAAGLFGRAFGLLLAFAAVLQARPAFNETFSTPNNKGCLLNIVGNVTGVTLGLTSEYRLHVLDDSFLQT